MFSFQNNPKNLDPSYKRDRSGSLGLFIKGKTCIIAKFHRTDSVTLETKKKKGFIFPGQ